ncbi:MAG: HTTM domain-containing protein, partial [Myxococcota bacterium]
IGLVTCWTLARIALSPVAGALFVPLDQGGVGPLVGDWRFGWLGGPRAETVAAVTAAAFASGALVAVGWWTRAAAFVAGQAICALMSLVPLSSGGHDWLLTNALWLLVLAPSDASWSLAARVRTGRWIDPTPRPAVVRQLVMLQLVVTYTVTGWQKLGPEWWPWGGLSAVYRALLQPHWWRSDLTWVADVYPVTQGMTAITLAWECGFPLVPLWMGLRHVSPKLARFDVRLVFLVVGLGVHATLEAALNLGPFAWVTLSFYPCFFSADELRGWFGARSAASSTSSP